MEFLKQIRIGTAIFMCSLIVFGCDNQSNQAVIYYETPCNKSFIKVSNIVKGISDSMYGGDKISFASNELPVVVTVSMDFEEFYVFVQENGELDLKCVDGQFSFSGNLSRHNQILGVFDSIVLDQVGQMGYNDLYRMESAEFEEEVKDRIKELEDLLKKIDTFDLDTRLRSLLFERISAIKKLYYLEYPENHRLLTGTLPQTTNNALVEKADFEDAIKPEYLSFKEGRLFIKLLIAKRLDPSHSTGDYYLNQYEFAGDAVSNKEVKSYLQYVFILEHLHYSDSLQMTYVQDFLANCPNELMKLEVSKVLEESISLGRGSKAPSFTGKSVEGKIFHLNDFKGKWIYLDVWAMWCGPCYREFSYFRELASRYKDSPIHFIGLSVDDPTEYERWKIFIKNQELGGIQLFGENGWSSAIVKNYNIENIPRFILIDPNGNIYDSEAHYPSEPESQNIFEKILE